MSMRYDLPNTSKGSSSLIQNLFIWGVPIFIWLLLILWWFFASDDEETSTIENPTTQVLPSGVNSGTQGATQLPVQNVVQSHQNKTVEPSGQQNKSTVDVAFGSPYDFSGARTKLPGINASMCQTGILVDVDQRRVLWAKKANTKVPIASMTKMMTLLLIEEAIEKGTVQRDTVIKVTKNAYNIGGAQVWLDPRESFPLSELTKAIAIRSANDAAYLVGEYLASGDIQAFIQTMNDRAKALGMKDTHFYDPHGLGDKKKKLHNASSAYDMILLGERLLVYPEIMKLTATRLDYFRNGKTELYNSNNLVSKGVKGVDGLKTGYTEASGFCVTFSVVRNNRRFLGCVTGFKSAKQRDEFCKKIIDWAEDAK